MVTRRNLFAMLTTMLILFFMFQFTGMAKTVLSDYRINEYAESSGILYSSGEMFSADQEDTSMGERQYVLFVGDENSAQLRDVVFWWCTYTKRQLKDCESLMEYAYGSGTPPFAVVIDGEAIDLNRSLSYLMQLTARGSHLIFARMPNVEALAADPGFCEFLGIRAIQSEQVELNGIHLFEGFLFGGERIYEKIDSETGAETGQMDLELLVPWYLTDAGTKTYIMGTFLEKGDLVNEELPAILWRKSAEHAMIFCVNADYLFRMSGIGFLDAMIADAGVYEIHPIVNAQNLSIVNFSGFADENDALMKEFYSQSQTAVYRDLIWPSLVSATYRSSFRLTLFGTAQTDYGDRIEPEEKQLLYFLKLLREDHGEYGISADRIAGLTPAERLARDRLFYQSGIRDYRLLSLYVKDEEELALLASEPMLAQVRTVASIAGRNEPPVRYLDGIRTFQNISGSLESHTCAEDLAVMAEETALGYSNVMMDLWNVSYPSSEDHRWENYSRYFSQNLVTYWKDFQCFSGTTMAESDVRIRRFLAMDYRAKMQEDQIVLTRNETDGPVWFLLKVNGRTVKQMTGGSFEAQKGGYYLIEMTDREAVIGLEEKQVSFYE